MVTYLGGGDISDGVPSEECNRLIKGYTSLGSNEIQGDEVDASGRLDVDVCNKLVAVNDLRSVIGFITYNQEVIHTSSGLNVSQIRIHIVLEQRSCDLIIEFKQRVLEILAISLSITRKSLLTLILSKAEL